MEFIGYSSHPVPLVRLKFFFPQCKHEEAPVQRKKGVASQQFHTRHSVYDQRDSTLPSDWGLGTSQGVMLSIGALKAKRLIYLPLVNFSTMTRCGCKSTRVVSRLISGIAASNPLVLRRSV
jgi:hypothetical protein